MTDDYPLTIVIISLIGGEPLARCRKAALRFQLPLLIINRDGSIEDAQSTLFGEKGPYHVPGRRKRGAELATTQFVAFIEDTVIPDTCWADRISDILNQEDIAAVGGPVSIEPFLCAQTQALALSEFGKFRPQNFQRLKLNSGGDDGLIETNVLPGTNFAFRRDILLQAMGPDGLVDNEVFAKIFSEGAKLVFEPSMRVSYAHQFSEGARLATRFHHGRIYASRHFAERSGIARLFAACKIPALPLLLVARSVRNAIPLPQHPGKLLGWIILQQLAWSAGELTGIVFGPGARGIEQWR